MAKYNPFSKCQFPEAGKFEAGNALYVTNFVYEPHAQNYDDFQVDSTFIMFLVTSGRCDFHTDYADFSLAVGDVAFAFPQKRYKFDGMEKLKLMYISFVNPEAMALLTALDITYSNPVRPGLKSYIKHFMSEFSRSFEMRSPQLIPKSLLFFALSHFEQKREDEFSRDKQALVGDIIKYIDVHYAEKCDLSVISKAVHFNYNYVSQVFKEITGTTVTKYVRNVRMKQAKKLLMETDKTVAAVSYEVGFSDPHYFEKQFKADTAITAKQFRQTYASGKSEK